jgi:hypothetical protein
MTQQLEQAEPLVATAFDYEATGSRDVWVWLGKAAQLSDAAGQARDSLHNPKIGRVIGRDGAGIRVDHAIRPDRGVYPGSPASRRPPPPHGCIVPVRSTGMNAPFGTCQPR